MAQLQAISWYDFLYHYRELVRPLGQNCLNIANAQLYELKEKIAIQFHKNQELVNGDDVKNYFTLASYGDDSFETNCLQAYSNAIRKPISNHNHSPQNISPSVRIAKATVECSTLSFYLQISGKIKAMTSTHKIQNFPTNDTYQNILILGANTLLDSWLDPASNFTEDLELQKMEDGNFRVVAESRISAPKNSPHFRIVITKINNKLSKEICVQSCRLIVNFSVKITVDISKAIEVISQYDNSPVDNESYAALSLLCNSHPDPACHIPLLYEPLIEFDEEMLENSRASSPAYARMMFKTLIHPFTTANHNAQKRCLLLYGPPGTGKTELAKELKETTGNEKKFSGAKMGGKHVQEGVQPLLDRSKLLVTGVLLGWYGGASEFRSMLQGQTEAKLSLLAELAERNQHLVTLVIIDELEKLVESRDKAASSNGPPSQTDHVLSMLNGISDIKNLLIVGMTNRVQDIDSAIISRSLTVPFLRPLYDERLKYLLSNQVPEEYANVIASIWLNSVPRSLVAFSQELLPAIKFKRVKNIEQAVELVVKSYTTTNEPPTRMAAQAHYPIHTLPVNKHVNNFLRTASLMICTTSSSAKRNIIQVSHFHADAKRNKHRFESEISTTLLTQQYFWEYCVNNRVEFSALIDSQAIESAFQQAPGTTIINPQSFINSLITTQIAEARNNVDAGRRALVFINVDKVIACTHDWNETSSNSRQQVINPNVMEHLQDTYQNGKVAQPNGVKQGVWSFMKHMNQKNEPAARVSHNLSMKAGAVNAEADVIKQTALGQIETGRNTSFKIVYEETFSLLTNLAAESFDNKSDGLFQFVFSISDPELLSRFMMKLQYQIKSILHHSTLAEGNHTKRSPYSPDWNGCEHYTRNCKIWCDQCKEFFACQECHNSQKSKHHKLISEEVTKMLCVSCNTIQIPAKQCTACELTIAPYFCGICNLWAGPNCLRSASKLREMMHCTTCQICCYPDSHDCNKDNQSLPVAERFTPQTKQKKNRHNFGECVELLVDCGYSKELVEDLMRDCDDVVTLTTTLLNDELPSQQDIVNDKPPSKQETVNDKSTRILPMNIPNEYIENVRSLVEMGYPAETAYHALKDCNNDLSNAVDAFLD